MMEGPWSTARAIAKTAERPGTPRAVTRLPPRVWRIRPDRGRPWHSWGPLLLLDVRPAVGVGAIDWPSLHPHRRKRGGHDIARRWVRSNGARPYSCGRP